MPRCSAASAPRVSRARCAPRQPARRTCAMYGKMASVTYEDFPDARLIVVWGANPSASGIHLVPYIREAQRRGAKLIVVDPRTTPLARAGGHSPADAPGHGPARRARNPSLSVRGTAAPTRRSSRRTRAVPIVCGPGRGVDVRARGRRGGRARGAASQSGGERVRRRPSPALIRCGWGQERNRNGGSASMAILALPAVAGKFGVRGGGYTMSNSASWGIARNWVRADEPRTRLVNMNQLGRALTEYDDPPVKVLFVYNTNAAVTSPHQRKMLRGLEREDLFTVVFDQVMTDTARYADVLLPATTFLEGYDLARGYGPISLRLGKPVVERRGPGALERRRLRRAAPAPGPEEAGRTRGRAGGDARRNRGICRRRSARSSATSAPRRRPSAAGRSSSATSGR